MLKNKLLLAALAASFAIPALAEEEAVTKHKEDVHVIPAAEVSYTLVPNVGVVTDYVFRGITQTSHSPAIQAGLDFAHSSGFYAGLWGSNVNWIKNSNALASGGKSLELDTYLGYKGAAGEVGYDIGLVRYNYLGNGVAAAGFAPADTAEAYGGVTYKWLSAKYSYGLLDGFLTFPGAKGTSYFDLTGTYTLEDSRVSLSAHLGRQAIKGNAAIGWSYTDYKLSASKDFSGYVLGAALTGTNASSLWTFPANGGNWGKTVVALSLTHSF